MSVPDFRFSPPDRRQIWRQLALTMSQASALTGVSERQIQHWMDKGYIAPAAEGARKIGGDSLDAIMLITQARAAGIPLRRAAPMARAYLSREATGALETRMAYWALQDLQDKLQAARTGIEAVQSVIEDVRNENGAGATSTLPSNSEDRVLSQRRSR